MIESIESNVDEITRSFPTSFVILAGDFNQMSEQEIIERTGLSSIVTQPTRGQSMFDRIYVQDPVCYDNVKVVNSVARSDHKAIIAFSGELESTRKTTQTKLYRKKTPTQNAAFLANLQQMNLDLAGESTQDKFDHFYNIALGLLNYHYPEKKINITSKDPSFITPDMKSNLKKKNRLMRAERLEEAGALAKRIGEAIARKNSARLKTVNGRVDPKDGMTTHVIFYWELPCL